jgi:hypothetical protein
VPLAATLCLIAGWIRYLAEVLPKVSFNWAGLGLMAGCIVLAAVMGHGFCRWLWRGTGHEEPWRLRWTIAGLATVVLMFASGMAVTGVAHQAGWLLRSPEPLTRSIGGVSNERNASASLKTVMTAQADFRNNDRDGNQRNDFWRGDIAGLYAIKPPGAGDLGAIKLIEVSIAAADARPIIDISRYATRAPKAGYWYRALRFKDEKEMESDPDRCAACAYPATPTSGKNVFIISDHGIMFRKLFDPPVPPEVFPAEPEKEGWSKLD